MTKAWKIPEEELVLSAHGKADGARFQQQQRRLDASATWCKGRWVEQHCLPLGHLNFGVVSQKAPPPLRKGLLPQLVILGNQS